MGVKVIPTPSTGKRASCGSYGAGFLQLNALMKAFQQMPEVGPVDLDDLILLRTHSDLDRDGVIGFEDFVAIGSQEVAKVVSVVETTKVSAPTAGAAGRAGVEGLPKAGAIGGAATAATQPEMA